MDTIAFADIFSALAENRPYRRGLNPDEILKELKQFIPHKLSEKIYFAIEKNMDELYNITMNV